MDLEKFSYDHENLNKTFEYHGVRFTLIRVGERTVVGGYGSQQYGGDAIPPLYNLTINGLTLTVTDISVLS
jgi:hypothetical protein